METVRGIVKKIIFHSEETGFKVMKVRIPAGPYVTITGEFGPEVVNGTVADFHGDYKKHPKYGSNFRTTSFTITHNVEELKSIELFLDVISPNIGIERAKAIVKHFGSETINVLDNEPVRLIEVEGVGKISADSLSKAWKENRDRWKRERQDYTLRAFLNSLGIKERKVKKILGHFGGGLIAEEKIRENPYLLTEVEGFGFSTADFIGRKLGIPIGDPLRLIAFIQYALNDLCPSNGHLYLTLEEMLTHINSFCVETNTTFLDKRTIILDDITRHLKDLINDGKIIKDMGSLYSQRCYLSESLSASKISKIIKKESDLILLDKEAITEHIRDFELLNNLTLSDEQRKALYYFVEKKVYVITGLPGSGKCLGYNTPVLMYDGTVKMVQDIVKGDLLMGDDSESREVLSTCTGREQMYKIIPVKGDPYIVNESHILSLKKTGKNGSKFDIPLKEYLNTKSCMRERYKGYRVPVEFESKELPIDPYLLGFWLGNGVCLSTGISTPYSEVIEHISNIVEKIGLSVKKKSGDNVDYYITCDRKSDIYKGLPDKRNPNPFLATLRDLKLIGDKHIPLLYKANSRANRLQLLAGLIDSNGSLNEGNTYDFISKDKKLAEDVAFLSRSLGFSAYISPQKKKWDCITEGKRYQGEGLYYRMAISGKGLEDIPCVVPKRKASPQRQIKDVLVTGIKAEPIGEGDYYGFEINGNGRFLLGDFTVTHNTLLLKAIVSLIKKLRLHLTCMAPTGISAKKMASTIGYDAYTIHRRLGFRGDSWTYGEDNKYETDVVLVDECSMIDQEVFYRLLSALKDRVHLIFVGDNHQLPSVGAGNVLRELIHCEVIPIIKLEHIFRQDKASDIIKVAHKIKNGDTDLSLFKSDPKADVFFIRENNTFKILDFLVKIAAKFKEEKRIFQIITPRNEGPLSVNELNENLQSALNPPGLEDECKVGTYILRRGDRVIIIKNDYELDVYNGEVGKITQIEGGKFAIDLDEKTVFMGIEEALEKVKLAYSISCHRSQGQEYPFIILPFVKEFGKNMLQRNLLYTAITRAKEKVIVIGHGSAIEKAINNATVHKRNTNLGERIRSCLSQKKKKNISQMLHGEQADSPNVNQKEEQFS